MRERVRPAGQSCKTTRVGKTHTSNDDILALFRTPATKYAVTKMHLDWIKQTRTMYKLNSAVPVRERNGATEIPGTRYGIPSRIKGNKSIDAVLFHNRNGNRNNGQEKMENYFVHRSIEHRANYCRSLECKPKPGRENRRLPPRAEMTPERWILSGALCV